MRVGGSGSLCVRACERPVFLLTMLPLCLKRKNSNILRLSNL